MKENRDSVSSPCNNCVSICNGCKNCPEWISWFTRCWQDAERRIKGEKRNRTDFEIVMVKRNE